MVGFLRHGHIIVCPSFQKLLQCDSLLFYVGWVVSRSPGFGLSLVSESSTGVVHSSETHAGVMGGREGGGGGVAGGEGDGACVLPEDVGSRTASRLIDEIVKVCNDVAAVIMFYTVYRENLAGIKFDNFSQNGMFLILADFKFGDSVPQPMSRGRGV